MHRNAIRWLFCSVILFLYSCVMADEWRLPYHDPANSSVSSDELKPPLRIAWTYRLAATDKNISLVASNEIIFVASISNLYAVDIATGQTLWKQNGDWAYACLIGDSIIAAGTRRNSGAKIYLASFKQATGMENWKIEWKSQPNYSGIDGVTAYHGLLYVVSNSDCIIWRINPRNGDIIKSITLGQDYWNMGIPAFHGNRLYSGIGHLPLFVDLSSFKATYLYKTYDGANCFPIIWNNHLLTQGWDNSAQIFEIIPGGLQYRFQYYALKGVAHGIAPGGNGRLLEILPFSNYLVAYDIVTGKQAWLYPTLPIGRCCATQKYVFVLSRNRKRDHRGRIVYSKERDIVWQYRLFMLSSNSGEAIWKKDFSQSFDCRQPVIANSRLFTCSGQTLYCLTSR